MGGNVLEYEAKTIRRQGIIEGRECVFHNLIERGYSIDDALAICEITRERAYELMKGIKNN